MTHASDLVVVGAGVVGVAHAIEAVRRGWSVQIVERDARAVGASVRNFGHACVTAQAGELRELAGASREGWLDAAQRSGLWASQAGAVVVARAEDELAVVEEFASQRDEGEALLLTASDVAARVGCDVGESVVGGAFFPADLRLDPRTTVAHLAGWLATLPQVTFHWRTTMQGAEPGVVHTSRGPIRGERIVICVGHDLDYVYPVIAQRYEMQRCRLSMALASAPAGMTDVAVLTGTSMLRYDGMANTSAAAEVRQRLSREQPGLIDVGANVMCTRRPDGTLLMGDSHHYDVVADPFMNDAVTEQLVEDLRGVLRAELPVQERWQGIYASSAIKPLIREEVAPGVRVVTVATGIGMTIAFGLARQTHQQW